MSKVSQISLILNLLYLMGIKLFEGTQRQSFDKMATICSAERNSKEKEE